VSAAARLAVTCGLGLLELHGPAARASDTDVTSSTPAAARDATMASIPPLARPKTIWGGAAGCFAGKEYELDVARLDEPGGSRFEIVDFEAEAEGFEAFRWSDRRGRREHRFTDSSNASTHSAVAEQCGSRSARMLRRNIAGFTKIPDPCFRTTCQLRSGMRQTRCSPAVWGRAGGQARACAEARYASL
jgi:hypothetical protein